MIHVSFYTTISYGVAPARESNRRKIHAPLASNPEKESKGD